jgi:hypothetical protein
LFNIDAYLSKVLKMGYKSSALSPLLWLNSLISLPCLIGSFYKDSDFRWALFIIATIIILFTLMQYVELRKINPNFLQSEKFQLEIHKMDMMRQQGSPIILDPNSLPLSEDPKLLTEDTEERHG